MQAQTRGTAARFNALLELSSQRAVTPLALGWLRLAVTALLLSGVFAFLVAMARTPLVAWIAGRDYLYTALVAHVTFALNVWLLSFTAALWVLVGGSLGAAFPRGLARLGLPLAWAGAALLAALPLTGVGEPVVADYVPLIEHPLFLLGLGSYFGGVALPALSFLAALRRRSGAWSAEVLAFTFSAVGYLVALASFPLAALRWGARDYATLVWGGGHLLQLVNGATLVGAWLLLAPALGRRLDGAIKLGLAALAGALASVGLYYASPWGWEPLSLVFWASLGAPIIVAWAAVAFTLGQAHLRGALHPSQAISLFFSLALFAAGGLVALSGMGSDTRVTAHYHGAVGAVTMAFMGLTYQLLWALGLGAPKGRIALTQPYLYGCGLLLLVAGLFWAGEAGTPRKLFQAIPKDPSLLAASALLGVGALATVAGGIAYVLEAGDGLLREVVQRASSNRGVARAVPETSGED